MLDNILKTGSLPLIFCVLAVIFIYIALINLFGFNIFNAIDVLFDVFKSKTKSAVEEKSEIERLRTARMSRDRKKKSLYYKYRVFVNDLLLDMNWKQMGVTQEGLTTLCLICTVLINIFGIFVFRSALVFIIGLICVYIVIICTLYTFSRSRARYRKSVLMATEDMLCASIEGGLVKSVERNLEQFDPEVKPAFVSFLDDRKALSMPIDVCIDRLNMQLGSRFDRFCEMAKSFELDYIEGLEDSFQINIEDNAIEAELDAEKYDAIWEMNIDYFGVVGILLAFFLMTTFMVDSVPHFYFEGKGRFLLALYLVALVFGYIYTQYKQQQKFDGGEI